MKPHILKDNRIRLILIASLAWGFLAHGQAMFNKYSFHDDVPWFNGVGETYSLGRWFLGITGKISEYLFCSRNYSTPLFNGVITILAIALMVYLLCRRLSITDRFLIIALTGVMISFPAITNIFAYVFTAPQYYIGAAMGVAGAYIFSTYKNISSFVLCTVLMALSTGLYQSNIGINLCALVLFMLADVYGSDMSWKEYITLAGKNVLVCIAFMAEYFAANALCLKVTGLSMYEYKGVNSFGKTDITGYILRVFTAYKRFIKPADFINYNGASANMFPWNLKYLHIVLVIVSVILIVILLKNTKNMPKIFQTGILFAVFPLCAYFFYVMAAQEDVHGGMAYSEVFTFALAAFVISRLNTGVVTLCRVAAILILIMDIMFARFANICYLKAEIMQSEAISYYTTLVTRIRESEGYTTDTPIEYIGARKKNDADFSGNRLFDPIYLPPFQGNSIINDFAWEKTMNMWCGFSRVEYDGDDLSDLPEVRNMPVYPDAGSIKMIDGVLVVKFCD